MRRHWRIYRVFVRSSLQRELEFRANFIAKLIQNVMWVGFALAFVLIVFANTNSIAGWSEGQTLVLTGTAGMLFSLFPGVFFSMMEIPTQVRQGTLDFVVTKPVDDQFWVSLRKFNFDQAGPFVVGGAMVAYGLHASHTSPALGQWLAWGLLAGCGLAIYYGICFAMMTSAIWFVRVENLWVLTETMSSVARTPTDVYPLGLRRFLFTALPLGLLATVPAKVLNHGLDYGMVGLSVLWAAIALVGSRLFWRFAMRHYGSASS
jgi:ABC-2 type transport system permease protein